MLPIPEFILRFKKEAKTHKIHHFFLKNWIPIFVHAELSFSLNNTKKKLHDNVPEMFKFNLKTSIQKISYL